MDRSMRIFVLLLLAGIWTTSLFSTAYPARAQALDRNIHVVEPGDTLNQIARQYGTDTATLRQLNNLDNADLLQVGQQLLVVEEGNQDRPIDEEQYERPNGNPYENEVENQEQWEAAESQPTLQVHIVQAGDDLRSIAAAYRIPPAALARENHLSAPVELEPGQRLRIPLPAGNTSWSPTANSFAIEPDAQESDVSESYRRQGEAYAPESYAPESYDRSYSREDTRLRTEATGEKWIDVDLSEQRLIAYQGDTPVRVFRISSGKSSTPTVTGSFRIWAKIDMQDMSGGSREAGTYYYQPDVPWVQYFYEDYAIHGAYWHNSFGRPVGQGCINMRVEEAQWLYEWTESEPSARVEVHD